MAVSYEQKKENKKIMTIYISIVMGIIGIYFFSYAGSMMHNENMSLMTAVFETCKRVFTGHFLFSISSGLIIGIIGGICTAVIAFFFLSIDNQRTDFYTKGEEVDTGGFMSKKEMNEYAKEYISKDPPALKDEKKFPVQYDSENDSKMYSQNIIMSNSFCRPINSRRLIGNNNILVVGGAGTGKSRFFIKPNMLQMNASYIITDPSGEMIVSLGKTLMDHGYKIKIFNISDRSHSNTYNPLEYVRDEAGVNMLIQCLIDNTTKGEGGGDNQFFVDAEKLLYSACIFYLRDFCQNDMYKNFAGVMSMINSSSVNENDPSAKSPLDELFDQLPKSSLAWRYYKAFKQAAGKTLKSIIISCVTRLQPFMTPQIVNLTRKDDLELDKIGKEKTALFIITPQADRTYSFLASMLYSQLFETLYYIGEEQKANGGSEQMQIPVRCLMDEFANIGEVPEFPSKLSTMRKYNISATIVLQDIAQIEAMYKDNWKTLVGNCSTIVFLGTQEPNTLKYFSDMLGQMTITKKGRSVQKNGSSGSFNQEGRAVMTPGELGRMDSSECLVFTQNRRPVKDKKYIYERHPYYDQTADANDAYAFQYVNYSIFDNTREAKIEGNLRARAAAARLKNIENSEKRKEPLTKIKHSGTSEELMNAVVDQKEEKSLINAYVDECIEEASSYAGNDYCIIKMKNVVPKLLPKVSERIISMLDVSPVIIEDNDVNPEHAFAFVKKTNPETLSLVLEHPAIETVIENDDGMVRFALSKEKIDQYINDITKKIAA